MERHAKQKLFYSVCLVQRWYMLQNNNGLKCGVHFLCLAQIKMCSFYSQLKPLELHIYSFGRKREENISTLQQLKCRNSVKPVE